MASISRDSVHMIKEDAANREPAMPTARHPYLFISALATGAEKINKIHIHQQSFKRNSNVNINKSNQFKSQLEISE